MGKKSKTCYIFGALDNAEPDFIRDGEDLVIACDAGLALLKRMGVKPDLIVGDFDSLGYVPNEDCEIIGLPVMKADTDTSYAVKTALERGYSSIVLYGGLGGARWDHTTANIGLAALVAEKGGICCLVDGGTVVTAVSDATLVFKEKDSGSMGFMSFSDCSVGVFVEGFLYGLSDHSLKNTDVLCVSNSFIGSRGVVGVKHGTLTVCFDGKPEDVEREDF